ncbi:MAG: GNAT family N-acetyltransferase [Clostridia bacterium]|nr:GNAT family N-acetyltransferase [Clostridia bacterium]
MLYAAREIKAKDGSTVILRNADVQDAAALLEQAKAIGYEQAELEVVADNTRAIALYESLGFSVCGRLPNNMKYSDGTYADALFMVKPL